MDKKQTVLYSITNGEEWITGNITDMCYEWTKYKEFRYAFPFEDACKIAEKYDGMVIRE